MKDLTADELDRELARLAGRPAPASRAPLTLSESGEDISPDELSVALARLTGRPIPDAVAEAAARDTAAREAREVREAARQAAARRGSAPRTVAEGAHRVVPNTAARRIVATSEAGPASGRRIVQIREDGGTFHFAGGAR